MYVSHKTGVKPGISDKRFCFSFVPIVLDVVFCIGPSFGVFVLCPVSFRNGNFSHGTFGSLQRAREKPTAAGSCLPAYVSCFVYSSTFLTTCVNPSVCLNSEINNQPLPPSPSTLKQTRQDKIILLSGLRPITTGVNIQAVRILIDPMTDLNSVF